MHLSEPVSTVIAVSGVVTGAIGVLLGNADPSISTESASWLTIVGGLTSNGFAVWYAWYTTTKTIPEAQKAHAEAMEKKDALNAAAMDKKDAIHAATIGNLVEEFRRDSIEQREFYKEHVKK